MRIRVNHVLTQMDPCFNDGGLLVTEETTVKYTDWNDEERSYMFDKVVYKEKKAPYTEGWFECQRANNQNVPQPEVYQMYAILLDNIEKCIRDTNRAIKENGGRASSLRRFNGTVYSPVVVYENLVMTKGKNKKKDEVSHEQYLERTMASMFLHRMLVVDEMTKIQTNYGLHNLIELVRDQPRLVGSAERRLMIGGEVSATLSDVQFEYLKAIKRHLDDSERSGGELAAGRYVPVLHSVRLLCPSDKAVVPLLRPKFCEFNTHDAQMCYSNIIPIRVLDGRVAYMNRAMTFDKIVSISSRKLGSHSSAEYASMYAQMYMTNGYMDEIQSLLYGAYAGSGYSPDHQFKKLGVGMEYRLSVLRSEDTAKDRYTVPIENPTKTYRFMVGQTRVFVRDECDMKNKGANSKGVRVGGKNVEHMYDWVVDHTDTEEEIVFVVHDAQGRINLGTFITEYVFCKFNTLDFEIVPQEREIDGEVFMTVTDEDIKVTPTSSDINLKKDLRLDQEVYERATSVLEIGQFTLTLDSFARLLEFDETKGPTQLLKKIKEDSLLLHFLADFQLNNYGDPNKQHEIVLHNYEFKARVDRFRQMAADSQSGLLLNTIKNVKIWIADMQAYCESLLKPMGDTPIETDEKFVRYVNESKPTYADPSRRFAHDILDKYGPKATLWMRKQEFKVNENAKYITWDPFRRLIDVATGKQTSTNTSNSSLIITRGIPGTGKTTMSMLAMSLIASTNTTSIYVFVSSVPTLLKSHKKDIVKNFPGQHNTRVKRISGLAVNLIELKEDSHLSIAPNACNVVVANSDNSRMLMNFLENARGKTKGIHVFMDEYMSKSGELELLRSPIPATITVSGATIPSTDSILEKHGGMPTYSENQDTYFATTSRLMDYDGTEYPPCNEVDMCAIDIMGQPIIRRHNGPNLLLSVTAGDQTMSESPHVLPVQSLNATGIADSTLTYLHTKILRKTLQPNEYMNEKSMKRAYGQFVPKVHTKDLDLVDIVDRASNDPTRSILDHATGYEPVVIQQAPRTNREIDDTTFNLIKFALVFFKVVFGISKLRKDDLEHQLMMSISAIAASYSPELRDFFKYATVLTMENMDYTDDDQRLVIEKARGCMRAMEILNAVSGTRLLDVDECMAILKTKYETKEHLFRIPAFQVAVSHMLENPYAAVVYYCEKTIDDNTEDLKNSKLYIIEKGLGYGVNINAAKVVVIEPALVISDKTDNLIQATYRSGRRGNSTSSTIVVDPLYTARLALESSTFVKKIYEQIAGLSRGKVLQEYAGAEAIFDEYYELEERADAIARLITNRSMTYRSRLVYEYVLALLTFARKYPSLVRFNLAEKTPLDVRMIMDVSGKFFDMYKKSRGLEEEKK